MMQELGTASEDDIILAFVQAELNSPKWGTYYKAYMLARSLDPARLLTPSNAAHRRAVLGYVRGFGRNDGLFRGFPLETKWRRVSIEPPDFSRLKYITSDKDWLDLSYGTRRVQDGAYNLDSKPDIWDKVLGTQRAIEHGHTMAELILVETDDLVIVEGHTRATAYVLLNRPFFAFVGTSPGMSGWYFV